MNLTDIITRVQTEFGDESSVQIDSDDITRWANDGQLDLARRTEALETTQEISVLASDNEYPLSADFLFEQRVTWNGYKLERKSRQELDRFVPNRDVDDATGSLLYYHIRSQKIKLYPVPSASEAGVNNLVIEYVKRPTLLINGSQLALDLPVEMHEDIVDYILARAKSLDEDYAAASFYKASYKERAGISASDSQYPYADSYPVIRDID